MPISWLNPQTPRNRCVRFVAGVAVGSRNTHYWATRYGPTQTGLPPVGMHQLWLAPSEIQARQLFLQPPLSPSITGFLLSLLIHFLAVGLFAVFAGVCIMHFGQFWLKGRRGAERQWTMEEVFYAVLMAVLVGAVFAAFAASATPPAGYSS